MTLSVVLQAEASDTYFDTRDFIATGTSTNEVSASSAFLDFPTEAKCRAAEDELAASD
jgi:hypothetical protein